MVKYLMERPKALQAIKFEEDVLNVQEVVDWVRSVSHGRSEIVWIPPVFEATEDGYKDEPKEEGYLRIKQGEWNLNVRPGRWLMHGGPHVENGYRFTTYDNESLENFFAPADMDPMWNGELDGRH